MEPTQNIIHSSSFNFEYGSKASATRGNALIESIFYSQILPELEQAIAKKIPDGVLVELAKLEIDIGTIDEKNLAESLADRIKASLEKALDFKLEIPTKTDDEQKTLENQKSGNFIISSIEMFLTRGYFPYALEKQHSIDELITSAIQKYKSEFIGILKKHRINENVIHRTTYNLTPDTLDEIIFAFEPVNADWIIEFRKSVIQLKSEMHLNHYSGTEFLQLLNDSIFKFLLNDTRSAFNKKSFATTILSGIDDIFQPYSQLLIRRSQNSTGKTATVSLIEETLTEIQSNKGKILSHEDGLKIPLEQLVVIINTGKIDLSAFTRGFLKKELIQAIKNTEKRTLLAEKLNEAGAIFLLNLFDKNRAQILYKLITVFTKEVVDKRKGNAVFNINSLVVQTALYLQEDTVRELNTEEFILFLVHSTALDETETINSSDFQNFIQNQENTDSGKFSTAVKKEQQFHEISELRDVLSDSKEQQKTDTYFTIYKRKIIDYYLETGQLPPDFNNLNQNDVQQIFSDLLEQRDNFLIVRIRDNEDSRSLTDRLNLLINNQTTNILLEYLIQFFPKEYSTLSKIIGEITQQFTFKSNQINTKSFLNEVLIQTLASSKGSNSPTVFTFLVFENLNSELKKDVTEPDKFFHYLVRKSGDLLQLNPTQRKAEVSVQNSGLLYSLLYQYDSELNDSKNTELKAILDLIQEDERITSHTSENISQSSENLKSIISVLKFYSQKGFFPWWANQTTVPGLIEELKKWNDLAPHLFEKEILLIEKEEAFLESLANKLSTKEQRELDTILSTHSALKKIWKISLQKSNPKEELMESGVIDIDEFLDKAHKNTEIFIKGLYLFPDDKILSHWLPQSPHIKDQLKEYLSLTPYFYYRNVTPPKWRQAVYGFSLEYYRHDSKTQDRFHNEFLSYLKKQYGNVRWTEVLTNVYHRVKSSEKKGNVSFPLALEQLLNIEVSGHSASSDDKVNRALSIEETGVETKIYNAGLIILWPFLTRLFEHLSLVKQGVFVNAEAMNRAVYILQHLVYNKVNFPEYELVLNKLLVGIQPEVHLVPLENLTNEEKDMTKSLLNGLMSNWEKVKDSTPEGIQETFLQREGMLTFKDEEILLTVEKKGVDVLLGSIPWNFSVVKLSWMAKPIHVVWI